MTKEELKEIAKQRVQLLIEYIDSFLENNVSARINLGSAKIEGNNMCTMDIYVTDGFERHFNSGIPFKYNNIFFEEALNRISSKYLIMKNTDVSNFYSKDDKLGNFSGFDIKDMNNNIVKINFIHINKTFQKSIDEFNETYGE